MHRLWDIFRVLMDWIISVNARDWHKKTGCSCHSKCILWSKQLLKWTQPGPTAPARLHLGGTPPKKHAKTPTPNELDFSEKTWKWKPPKKLPKKTFFWGLMWFPVQPGSAAKNLFPLNGGPQPGLEHTALIKNNDDKILCMQKNPKKYFKTLFLTQKKQMQTWATSTMKMAWDREDTSFIPVAVTVLQNAMSEKAKKIPPTLLRISVIICVDPRNGPPFWGVGKNSLKWPGAKGAPGSVKIVLAGWINDWGEWGNFPKKSRCFAAKPVPGPLPGTPQASI